MEQEPHLERVIEVLPPDLANLIAAGEVVERPASVVKELLENAIDAGATSITVEIRNGGTDYLRITDNGKGIPPSQLPTAFLRHATSKLKVPKDLEEIYTLGFRGEALAAIAAVSKIKVTSGMGGETFAQEMILEGGEIISQEETGAPTGTTMLVEDLFYNTPARKKFMKTTRGEGGAISSLVQVVALSHPEISFKFIRDYKSEWSTSGDGQLSTAIFHVLGKDIALGLRPVEYTDLETSVSGFTSIPSCCRGSRNYQHFFVNGRYIKSPLLCAAVEDAYTNSKMVGKFPAAVLHLTMDHRDVDVNVHPAKTQVKFAREQDIFRLVRQGVLHSLAGNKDIQKVEFEKEITKSPNLSFEAQKKVHVTSPSPERTPSKVESPPVEKKDSISPPSVKKVSFSLTDFEDETEDTPTFPVFSSSKPSPSKTTAPDSPPLSVSSDEKESKPSLLFPTISPPSSVVHSPLHEEKVSFPLPSRSSLSLSKGEESVDIPEEEWDFSQDTPSISPSTPKDMEETPSTLPDRQRVDWKKSESEPFLPEPEVEEPSILENYTFYGEEPPPWKVVGEFFRTYIAVEMGEEIFFIDKHAAHERMNFNRLKDQNYRPMPQDLLSPKILHLSPEEFASVEQHQAVLEEFSFNFDIFPPDSVALRSVPFDVPENQLESTFHEILDSLMSGACVDPDATRDHLLHSISCKAAIKAGYYTHEEEQAVVAQFIMEDKVRHCPHGRPIIASLSKKDLEKKFKRIQ